MLTSYQHIFGPVLSRRLGVSLGVDLVTHKICSMNCLYCECGRTTRLTCEKKPWVRLETVIQELFHYFEHHEDPDYITFSGSGEPTLNSCIGSVIDYIKKEKPKVKVAVLTNSTLFDDPNVRRSLLKADLVIPSLDAARPETFSKTNRPHKDVSLDAVIQGLAAFRNEYAGLIWLEILILPGINDADKDLKALNEAAGQIKPDLIQLNTLDRPGTRKDLVPAAREDLEKIADLFRPIPTEIIAGVKAKRQKRNSSLDARQTILQTIHRRPCTKAELEKITGLQKDEIDQWINTLEKENRILGIARERGMFYRTVKEDDTP